jgi:hypothetical protein
MMIQMTSRNDEMNYDYRLLEALHLGFYCDEGVEGNQTHGLLENALSKLSVMSTAGRIQVSYRTASHRLSTHLEVS